MITDAAEPFELTPAVPCPNCGTASRVREIFSASTFREDINGDRGERSKSLGNYAYCPKCNCSFKVTA